MRTACVATALRDELLRASGCLGAQPVLTQRYLRTGDGEGAAGSPQPSCCLPRSTQSCTCSGWRSQTRPPSRLHRWFRGGTRTRSSALGSSLACAGQRDQASRMHHLSSWADICHAEPRPQRDALDLQALALSISEIRQEEKYFFFPKNAPHTYFSLLKMTKSCWIASRHSWR